MQEEIGHNATRTATHAATHTATHTCEGQGLGDGGGVSISSCVVCVRGVHV